LTLKNERSYNAPRRRAREQRRGRPDALDHQDRPVPSVNGTGSRWNTGSALT
jgi:hypothetical protein